MNKVSPVLRYPGSKFKKLDKIIEILDIKETDTFLDMFGGSGIVGVNVKSLTNATVYINDYDNVLPVKESTALKNMLSFEGMGNNFTKSAFEYFCKRVNNGYWEKLKKYNEVLDTCNLVHQDWCGNYINWEYEPNKVYVDPPYDDIDGLYKKSFSRIDHQTVNAFLEEVIHDFPDVHILVSYNDTPFIRELYKDWYVKQETFQYSSGSMSKEGKKKKVEELFLSNKPFKE